MNETSITHLHAKLKHLNPLKKIMLRCMFVASLYMTLPHGHARAYVAFDLLKRVLKHAGYTVNHVQNFTDIDDKIIDRSNKNNEGCSPIKPTIY